MKFVWDYGIGFEKNVWYGLVLLFYGMVQKVLGQDGVRYSFEVVVVEFLEVSGVSVLEMLQVKVVLVNG